MSCGSPASSLTGQVELSVELTCNPKFINLPTTPHLTRSLSIPLTWSRPVGLGQILQHSPSPIIRVLHYCMLVYTNRRTRFEVPEDMFFHPWFRSEVRSASVVSTRQLSRRIMRRRGLTCILLYVLTWYEDCSAMQGGGQGEREILSIDD